MKKLMTLLKPQLATLQDTPPSGDNWIHEAKFDGYRTLAIKEGANVKLFTRNGNDWTKTYSLLAEELKKAKVKSVILDGEIVALDDNGLPSFNKLQHSVGRRNTKQNVPGLVYYVFDILFLDNKDLRQERLEDRKAILQSFLKKNKSLKHHLYSEEFDVKPEKLLKHFCSSGLEGMISKKKDSPYTPGRNENWIKTKCQLNDEFMVIGYQTGKSHPLGAILLGSYSGKKLIYAGKVGTGFTNDEKKELLRQFMPLKTNKPPIEEIPKLKDIIWLKPKLIAEVNYLSRSVDGLRHSSFKTLRTDKKISELKGKN